MRQGRLPAPGPLRRLVSLEHSREARSGGEAGAPWTRARGIRFFFPGASSDHVNWAPSTPALQMMKRGSERAGTVPGSQSRDRSVQGWD